MEVVNNYLPGDSRLVQQLLYELKSQGIFDQFRRECIADVDTKPAYQNLRQRVEGSVSTFLKQQTWSPDMNKNQVREQLRKNIYESGYLETGVERIVDQVVNPKINVIFLPQVEDVVYRYLGIAKPEVKSEVKPEAPPAPETKKELKLDITDLLPRDLEAISPESDHSFKNDSTHKVSDLKNKHLTNSVSSSSKPDEDESPPFEPLGNQLNVALEENSVDSHLSGISGLQSHDSNLGSATKVCQMEISNQGSLESQNSSESQLSVETSEDTKMEIRDDSDSKLINSNDSDLTLELSTGRQMETEISVQADAGENNNLKNREEVAHFKPLEYDDTSENNEYTNKLPDGKGQEDNLPEKKCDSEKYEENKNVDINLDEKKTDDGKNQERKSDNRKYIEKKDDDKKSRSSDKYISKTYKDDKHRKSSSSSSSKEKSSSKHSSKNKEYTSSTKDKELGASSTKYKEYNSSSLKNKEQKDYVSSSSKDKEYISSSKDNEFSASSKDKEYSSSSSKDKEYSPSAAREKNSTSSLKQKDQASMSIKEKEYASSSNRDKNKSHKKSKSASSKDKEKNEKNKDGVEDKSEKEKEKYVRVKEKSEKEREKANKEKEKSGTTKDSGKHKSEEENHKGAREKSDRDKDKSEKEKEKLDREKESFSKESPEKEKISREKEKLVEKSDKSRKEKEKQDKVKEKTDKSKEKSHKVKTEKEKPELENEKPVKEKGDKDKTRSSSSSSSKHSNNKDKNSSSLKRESTSTSVRDKEKSHHSSTTSKDKSKSNQNDSSSVHKKDDKNIQNGKHSSSSSSLRKDKEKKRDSKKRLKDDHYSSKDKKINRRSTDRDSNDGQSGKQIHSNSFTSNSALFSQNTNGDSSSNIGSGSGDSGNSDQVEQTILKSTLKPPESVEGGEVQAFKYSKPKFASNFQEARKIMRIRKQLAKLERQNQLSLAHVEIGTSVENGFSSEESKSISYNVENINRDKLNSVNNTDTEKENCSSTKENNANQLKMMKEKNFSATVQKNNVKVNENKTFKWVEKSSVVKENNKIYKQNLCVDIFPLNKKDIKEKINIVMKNSDVKETSVLARDVSLTEELKMPEDKMPDCKNIMKSKDLSKENWEALEARLAQEMSTVNCNSYESPRDDIDYVDSRTIVGPKKNDKISEKLCNSQVIAEKRIKNEKNIELEESRKEQKTRILDEKIIVEDTNQLRYHRFGETVSEKEVKDKTRRTGPIKTEITIGDNNGIVCRQIEESRDKKDEYIECKRIKVINNKRNSIKELSVVLDGDKRTKIDNSDKKMDITCDSEDQCQYLEKPSPNSERHLQIIHKFVEKLEKDVQHSAEASCSNLLVVKQSRKRKLDETVDMKNNNKAHYEQLTDISSTESFTLPLSPAESDRSNDKKRKITKKRNVFDRSEDEKVKIVNTDEKLDSICEGLDKCLYLEKPSPDSERCIQIIRKVIERLENDVQRSIEASRNDFLRLNRGRKRKLDENVMKNSNKTLYEETLEYKGKEAPISNSVLTKVNKDRMCNTSDVSSTESFSLPLSPAESEKSNDKKEKNTKERKAIGRTSTSRNQKYSNEDLYKPRLSLSTRRSRGAQNIS